MSLKKNEKFKVLLLNETDQPIKTIAYINSKTSEQYSIHKKRKIFIKRYENFQNERSFNT